MFHVERPRRRIEGVFHVEHPLEPFLLRPAESYRPTEKRLDRRRRGRTTGKAAGRKMEGVEAAC